MTFFSVYVDNMSFVGRYDSRDEAREAVLQAVQGRSDLLAVFGVIEIDEDNGEELSDFVSAATLWAQGPTPPTEEPSVEAPLAPTDVGV